MMRMPAKEPTQRAFTLVELLAFITVLFFLVLLLLPVFSFDEHKARQAKCLANAMSITTAILQETERRGGRLPETETFWGLPKVLKLNPGEAEAFECPCDRGADDFPRRAGICFTDLGTSYMYPVAPIDEAGIVEVMKDGRGLDPSHPSLAYPSKKAILFEPPLVGKPAEKISIHDQWHDQRRASVIGLLDGHVDFIRTNFYGDATTNNLQHKLYY
jgi:type II secretory pathway pseudopilin PulG